MNKIYRIVSASLAMVLLLLGMNSCTQERLVAPEAQPEAGAGQLAFSLDNDALRSVPAEAYEKAVNEHSVWCVFVTPTGAGGAQTVQAAKQAHKTAAGSYSVNAGFSGAAQMFVIGNVESELQSKLYNLTSGTPLSEVQSWIVKNSLGNGTDDPAKFVMTSEMVDVMLPSKGAPATNLSQAIQLKRLAARFDVINEVPGLKLTTVSVANRIVTSTLLDVQQTGEKVATTDYTIADGKVLLHKIYSYQNSNKGSTQDATSFTIQGTYKGKAIKPISVKLQDATTTEALDVQRNHCYRILLKPTGEDFNPIKPDDDPKKVAWKIVVKVLDWNEAADLGNYSDEDLANLGDKPDPTVNTQGKNLLNAVAEYNIDITGTKFTTSHNNAAGFSGYFTWSEAKALKMPEGYHIPTAEEWSAILGVTKTSHVRFSGNETNKDDIVTVQIPGKSEKITCKQDYKQVPSEKTVYMIRYKDNETYRSAWRYSYVASPIASQMVIKIESVPVNTKLTIEKLNKDYFAKPNVRKYVKTKFLSLNGCDYSKNGSGSVEQDFERGSCGGYWTSTDMSTSSTSCARVVHISANRYGCYIDIAPAPFTAVGVAKARLVLRPFRNL